MVDKNVPTNRLEKELLLRAAESGVLKDVMSLVSRGYDVDLSDFKGVTPLMAAVNLGHSQIVKYLCENSADVNKTTNNGETALYRACNKVKCDMVGILLEAGSDVNIKTNELHPQTRRTPLMAALPSIYEINFRNGKKSEALYIVKMLLSRECDVNARDWKGDTALHLAADQNDLHTVCLLAEHGADLHIRNNYGLTPFEDSVQPNKQRYSIATILLLYGYDIEKVPSEPHPLVSVVNGFIHPEAKYFPASRITRKMLLDLFYEVVHLNSDLKGKISECMKNCQKIAPDDVFCLRRFLKRNRLSSLQHLCRNVIRKALGSNVIRGIRQLPVARSIKQFLALNVDIDRHDPLKVMELNTAIKECDTEKVRQHLLNYQTDVNFSFSDQTPLTEAVSTGNFELCKILIESGAQVDLPDNMGMTALQSAFEKGHHFIATEMLKHARCLEKVSGFSSDNAVT